MEDADKIKNHYKDHNLDLTYITPRLIAMTHPTGDD